jgi:hypothetical protein
MFLFCSVVHEAAGHFFFLWAAFAAAFPYDEGYFFFPMNSLAPLRYYIPYQPFADTSGYYWLY